MKIRKDCAHLQRKFRELEAAMDESSQDYVEFAAFWNGRNFGEVPNKTRYWEWMVGESPFDHYTPFMKDPPIGMGSSSNRILFAGRNCEIYELATLFGDDSDNEEVDLDYIELEAAKIRQKGEISAVPGLMQVIDSFAQLKKNGVNSFSYARKTYLFWRKWRARIWGDHAI